MKVLVENFGIFGFFEIFVIGDVFLFVCLFVCCVCLILILLFFLVLFFVLVSLNDIEWCLDFVVELLCVFICKIDSLFLFISIFCVGKFMEFFFVEFLLFLKLEYFFFKLFICLLKFFMIFFLLYIIKLVFFCLLIEVFWWIGDVCVFFIFFFILVLFLMWFLWLLMLCKMMLDMGDGDMLWMLYLLVSFGLFIFDF